MHMEMVLVLLVSLVICQIIILLWKNYHLKSYQVTISELMKKIKFLLNLFSSFLL